MKTKHSVIKVVGLLAFLAGMLLVGYTVQAASARAGVRQGVLMHNQVELARDIHSVAVQDDSNNTGLKRESEPRDDNGGMRAAGVIEPGDDKDGLTPGDDKDRLETGEDRSGMVEDNHHQNAAGDDDASAAVPQPGEDIELTGQLTAINGSSLTVDGVSVVVSGSTEMKSGLRTGDLVKVEGILNADGSIQAREIKPGNAENIQDNLNHNSPAPAASPSTGVDDRNQVRNRGGDNGGRNDGGDDGAGHH